MAKASEIEAFWAGAAPEGRARYSELKLVGSGAYSVVARARDTQTNEMVAIKRIAEVFYDAQEAKKVLREIRLLRDFAHANVISLKALIPPMSMETFDDIFMVTDFMESDLRRVIKSKQQLAPGKVRSYMAQLLAGLEHVHRHSGIHRDLKPANVLVSHTKVTPATPYGLVRLCDFGLARVDSDAQEQSKRELDAATQVDNTSEPEADDDAAADALPRSPPSLKKQMTSYVVTRWYRAPEVILRERYTYAIDLWAVGCIFKEMLELTAGTRPTGALFPGKYCIPFSFDSETRERQRYDQLAVITRTLGAPTAHEMAWASAGAQEELRNVCQGDVLSTLEWTDRQSEIDRKLREACPVVADVELELMRALLAFDPGSRPRCAQALTNYSYFAPLTDDERAGVAISGEVDAKQVEAAFAFEAEQLGSNELRILLANDLFRMVLDTDRQTQTAAAAAATTVDGGKSEGAAAPIMAPQPVTSSRTPMLPSATTSASVAPPVPSAPSLEK